MSASPPEAADPPVDAAASPPSRSGRGCAAAPGACGSGPTGRASPAPDWADRIMDVAVTDRFHAKQGRSTGRWVLDATARRPGG